MYLRIYVRAVTLWFHWAALIKPPVRSYEGFTGSNIALDEACCNNYDHLLSRHKT